MHYTPPEVGEIVGKNLDSPRVISENAIAQTEKLWDIARERLIHGLGAPGASSALTLKKSSREVGVKNHTRESLCGPWGFYPACCMI